MNRLSNLPPGVTDGMIEEHATGYEDGPSEDPTPIERTLTVWESPDGSVRPDTPPDALVKIFNERFPPGSVVQWRSIGKDCPGNEYKPYTVAHRAYNTYGQAVAFFKEKPGYCSIESRFVKYANS